VAIGLLPGIAAWGALMLKTGLRSAGMGSLEKPFSPDLIGILGRSDIAAHGVFALEQGFLLTSMVWAALTVAVIERRFAPAALWSLGGALLSLSGLAHTYAITPSDTVQDLAFGKAWPFALAYTLLAGLLLLGRWLKPEESGRDNPV